MQGLFSKADARDRITGERTPEAPRQIWDILATVDQLPFLLVARGQYEEVGLKGFIAIAVREFRGAVIRPFPSKSFDVGVNTLISRGYGGQTLETLALPGEEKPFERITGFPLKSYVSASFTYHFPATLKQFQTRGTPRQLAFSAIADGARTWGDYGKSERLGSEPSQMSVMVFLGG